MKRKYPKKSDYHEKMFLHKTIKLKRESAVFKLILLYNYYWRFTDIKLFSSQLHNNSKGFIIFS